MALCQFIFSVLSLNPCSGCAKEYGSDVVPLARISFSIVIVLNCNIQIYNKFACYRL